MLAADMIGFFLVLALFGLAGMASSTKVNTAENYLLANRHTGLVALIATLVMTELNTSTLISFSSAGFFAGDWALALPLVFLLGLGFYAISVAKKYRDFAGRSIAEVFAYYYGKRYARLVSFCLLVAMTGFSSTYIRSLSVFFSPLLALNPWLLSFIMVMTILLFTVRGGLVAIIKADLLSFALVLIFFPLIFYWTKTFEAADHAIALDLVAGQNNLPPNFIASLIILTCFTYILAPWYGQKIFSAKNARIAYLAVAISAVLVFLLYGLMVLACSHLQKTGLGFPSAELALPYIFSSVIPMGFKGAAYALVFTIGATTLAGVWSAMTTMVVADFLEQTTDIKTPMIITIAFAAITFVLANTLVDNIFNKMILANVPVFALSFALLAAFYWPKVTALGAHVSTAVGLGWGLFCYGYFGDEGSYTIYWAFIGLPLIFGSGILASLASQKKSVEIAN